MKPPDPGSPRLRDAATLLPVLAVFLLMPPVITLFTDTRTVGGVPLIVAYLFGVWLALIVAAALLAHRLAPPAASTTDALPAASPSDALPVAPPSDAPPSDASPPAAPPPAVPPPAVPPHTALPGAAAPPAPRD